MDQLVNSTAEVQSSTFRFENVDIKARERFEFSNTTFSKIIESNKKIFQEGDKKHLVSDKSNTFRPYNPNGLMGAILTAYNYHLPLVLRPDDIWVNIMITFGNYVVKHSEEMRDCFVEHEGRKALEVKVQSPYLEFTTEEHWASFLDIWEKVMDENVKDDLSSWMVPNFTTTTRRDQAVSRMVMMGAMKEYFSYKTMLCCGLSEVTLMGSLKDWQDLQERARGLYKFDQKYLSRWADVLIPVLGQFVDAYQGKVEEGFWQRVATSSTYGSGGQRTYKGWIVAFCPFDDEDHFILNKPKEIEKTYEYGSLDADSIVLSHIKFPMEIDDHGIKYLSNFHAGMLLTEYNESTQVVKPSIDLAIYLTQELTLQDMEEKLEKLIKSHESSYRGAKVSEGEKQKIMDCIKFAYFAADTDQFNMPNDTLRDWARNVFRFFQGWVSRGVQDGTRLPGREEIARMEGAQLYKQYLVNTVHHEYMDGAKFAKYIVKSRIDEVVKAYLDQQN